MWKRHSIMPSHHGSRWAWLSLALLAAFGVIIYALVPTDGADVGVRESRCFPVHWCLPGTTAGESAIDVAPTSDTPQSAERIDARAGAVSGKCSFRKRPSHLQRLLAGPMSAHLAIGSTS